jgi:lipopolysaccharide transport system permease protein
VTINFRASNLRASDRHVKSSRPAVTYKNLNLLIALIRRDFSARFTGSALGVAWAVLQPLSLVALYWCVFTYFVPQSSVDPNKYFYFLIAGLIPWLAINEGIIRSTTAIVENAPMVRRLAFRSELLVVVPNASAIIFELVALTIFLGLLLIQGRPLTSIWLLPFAIVLQFVLQLGFGWFLAATYVFFRDLTQILGFALSIIFYVSPILYPVVGRFKMFFAWNPMTPLLGLFRSAMLSAALPDVGSIVFLLTIAAVVFAAGLTFFRQAQPAVVDLI